MMNTDVLLDRAHQAIAEAKSFCDETRACVAATRQRFEHLHRPASASPVAVSLSSPSRSATSPERQVS